TPHDQIDSRNPRGEDLVLVDADVREGDDEVGPFPDLGDEDGRNRDGIGDGDARISRAAHDGYDVLRREPEDPDLDASHILDGIWIRDPAKRRAFRDPRAADPLRTLSDGAE